MIGAGNFALSFLTLSTTSLALPSTSSHRRRDDAEFEIPPPLGAEFRKCYPVSDRDFFPQNDPRSLRYGDCAYALRDLVREYKAGFYDPRQLWYTSSPHTPPAGLAMNALQMPITRQIHGCAIAVLSHKALGDLVQLAGMTWREEWGVQPTPGQPGKEIFDGLAPGDWVGDKGISTALGCVNDYGAAGYRRLGEFYRSFMLRMTDSHHCCISFTWEDITNIWNGSDGLYVRVRLIR